LQTSRAAVRRHAFKIAKRLERDRLQAEVFHHPADIAWRAVERQEIVLEQFNELEACVRNRLKLLTQAAAQAHSRDCVSHRIT
jgi:hypothetical protein